MAVARGAPVHFDRAVKLAQKARIPAIDPDRKAAYLRDEIASRIVDRLDDTTIRFPLALDLGCGDGSILRAVEDRGGIEKLVMVDPAESLVSRVNECGIDLAPETPKFETVVADDETYVHSEKVDLILTNLSVHWMNDLSGFFSRARQSLKPNGMVIGALLGANTLHELRSSLILANMERRGGVGTHVSPMLEVSDVGDILTGAGFALPAIDIDTITVQYRDAFHLMEHLQMMGEGNAVKTKRLWPGRDTFAAAAAIYQEVFGDSDGCIPATFQIIYFNGWVPHESQQKPDARGSATASLKDLTQQNGPGQVPPATPPPTLDGAACKSSPLPGEDPEIESSGGRNMAFADLVTKYRGVITEADLEEDDSSKNKK